MMRNLLTSIINRLKPVNYSIPMVLGLLFVSVVQVSGQTDTIYTCNVTDASAVGEDDGWILLGVEGLEEPYSFQWETAPPQYSQAVMNLSRGVYFVEVVDGNGFIDTTFCAVGEPYVSCDGLRTQTQGGWGQKGRGNNPGAYRDANFDAAFPSGLVIGCSNGGNTITLTSANRVRKFLPQGKQPRVLNCDLTNPTRRSYRNVFAGQVAALALSVGFDNYDPDFGWADFSLADQEIAYGTFQGWTVQELLDEANSKLGGCGSSYSIGELHHAVTRVNENFVDCKRTGGFLNCSIYYGSSIGDYIWNDLNGDGEHNQGEPGLENVTVRLRYAGADNVLHTSDDEIFTTQTDALGVYDFTQLDIGEYELSVDDITLPMGFALTAGQDPRQITLYADQDFNNGDFGYQQQNARVGDLVYKDSNFNGQQDAGEPGIENVDVNLVAPGLDGTLGTSDDVYTAVTTDANGNYIFEDLVAGDYAVQIIESSYPNNFALTTADQTIFITLAAGQEILDADFGLNLELNATVEPAGFNFDCATGEKGVYQAAAVDCNSGNVSLNIAASDVATENYVFVIYNDDFDPGTEIIVEANNAAYKLSQIPLTGTGALERAYGGVLPDDVFSLSHENLAGSCGNSGGLQSIGVISRVPSASGQSVSIRPDITGHCDLVTQTIDIPAEVAPRNLDVTIPLTELSNDGRHLVLTVEAGGVSESVTLFGPDSDGGCCNAERTISLQNVPGNATTVSVTFDGRVDSDPMSTQNCGQSWVVVGLINVDINCVVSNATIDGFVYEDTDGSALQEAGEQGLSGITVDLRGSGPDGILNNGDDVFETTTTGTDGSYSFTDLAPGEYEVTVDGGTVPTQFNLTTSSDSYSASLGEGDTNSDGAIGYRPFNSTIGDFVFEDINGNGLFDATEDSGIPGVSVVLSSGGTPIDTVVTDAIGRYSFSNLPPADYSIQIGSNTVPTGFVNSTVASVDVSLGAGEINGDGDFGLQPRVSALAGGIWEDENEDGVRDPAEDGIENVDVILTYAGPDGVTPSADDEVFTATTDSDGNYEFTDLPSGEFTLSVDTSTVPDGFESTGSFDPISLGVAQNGGPTGGGFSQPKGTIRGIVWDDEDGDGVKDFGDGETGVAGVTVELLNSDGTPTGSSTVTDANGLYSFNEVTPGDYKVSYSGLPTDFVYTNEGADSKAGRGSGETTPFTVSGNALSGDIDAGIALPGKVEMTVLPFPDFVFTEFDPVTYTYSVTNTGGVPLDAITIDDVDCPPVYVSGDINNNNKLEKTETWIYQCTRTWTWTVFDFQLQTFPTANADDVLTETSSDSKSTTIFTFGANMELTSSHITACPGDTITISMVTRMLATPTLEADRDVQFYDVEITNNLIDNGNVWMGGPSSPYFTDPSGDYENTMAGAMLNALDYDDFTDVDNGFGSSDWVHSFDYVIPTDQSDDLVVIATDNVKAHYYNGSEWAIANSVKGGADTIIITMDCPAAFSMDEDMFDNIFGQNEEEEDTESEDEGYLTLAELEKTSVNVGVNDPVDNVVGAYPSPFTNELNITWDRDYLGGNLELYNSMGQRIYFDHIGLNKVTLNTTHLSAGVYYVRISKDDLVETIRVIKH